MLAVAHRAGNDLVALRHALDHATRLGVSGVIGKDLTLLRHLRRSTA